MTLECPECGYPALRIEIGATVDMVCDNCKEKEPICAFVVTKAGFKRIVNEAWEMRAAKIGKVQ